MKLFEFEAKEILKHNGVPIPEGYLATSCKQAIDAAEKIGKSVALKAQVLLSGRGKAGGIVFAASAEEVEKSAERLLHSEIKDTAVEMLLVEETIPIKRELYYGVTVDRLNRSYVLIASSTGGIEVEEIAVQSPETILRTLVDPNFGFHYFQARKIAKAMGYNGKQELELGLILENIYRLAIKQDAIVFEINPLVETSEGKFVAADARIIIDDNALFRHQEFEKKMLEENRGLPTKEKQAMKSKIDYVKLQGNIGIMGNGAGLVMATLDLIGYYGGKPANFLDLGGGATTERTIAGLKIILQDPDVNVAFINILGGITHCDEVARAIVKTKETAYSRIPMVIRLVGTREEEGKQILRAAGLNVTESMEEAAKRAVEISKKEGNPIGNNSKL